MTPQEIQRHFNLLKPTTWSFVIGCTGTSSQIPDEEKWCDLDKASHLFNKEFVPHYHGSIVTPPWEYWEKHGLCISTASSDVVCPFVEVAKVLGREGIEKLLGRSMPGYLKFEQPKVEVDPYADAVPMPGAGKSSPRIKDVKGERLS